jgi:hypothetical protein
MARLGDMGSDTSDTSEKNKRYQEKPIVHAGCTPDTSDTSQFAEPPKPAQIDRSGRVAKNMPPTKPADPSTWHDVGRSANSAPGAELKATSHDPAP